MNNKKNFKVIKLTIIIVSLVLLIVAIYIPLKLTGTLNKINNIQNIKQFILDGGIYSYLIFFAIQFIQVIFLPIPALVTTIAGALVFGPWISALISFIGVFLGSLFAFYLGRRFGRKLVVWIVGEDETKKWQKKLEKGKYAFFLMMLFPVFPDDVLCLLVGAVTSISYKFFVVTNLITRPIAILCTTLFGGGHIIPFYGWGIFVWVLFLLVCIVLLVFSFKYQSKIERFINKMIDKLNKK